MNEDTHEKVRASLAANVLRLGNECRDLAAENARLKADFSQMTAWGRGLESDLSRARVELMLVKAEVERLKRLLPSEDDTNRGGFNP